MLIGRKKCQMTSLVQELNRFALKKIILSPREVLFQSCSKNCEFQILDFSHIVSYSLTLDHIGVNVSNNIFSESTHQIDTPMYQVIWASEASNVTLCMQRDFDRKMFKFSLRSFGAFRFSSRREYTVSLTFFHYDFETKTMAAWNCMPQAKGSRYPKGYQIPKGSDKL